MPLSQSLKSERRELESELQLILNAVVEGICGLDAKGMVTFCNEALLKMTGYESAEMMGKNLHELLHHSRRDGTRYPLEECAASQAIRDQQEIHIEGEFFWRKDGTCFPTEYWAHAVEMPWSLTAYVVTIQDLTENQQSKDVLRRSEEKFRRILAGFPDVAWTSDRDGRTVYISPKVDAILGYSKQEICGGGANLWLGRIHPEDFGRVKQAYGNLFEQQIPFDQEYRIRRKDDVWIWVHDRAVGTREQNGVRYADGVLSDVTRRKQAEAELHSKTAFLEAQANSTIDGIVVVAGRKQRLLLNQRMIDLFQVPPEIVANKDDRHLQHHILTLIKDPESFLAKIERLNQRLSDTSRDEIEFKDGRIFDCYSAPVVGDNGIYYGRIWTFRDITERKRNEDTLRQLSFAVEQSPVSVLITDPRGNISYVNRKFTEVTGYRPEEVVGRNPRILKSGLTPKDLYQNLWTTIRKGDVWHGEFCNRKKNGDVYWEAATITPITDPKGAITHFLALKEDVTARKQAERELRLTQASLGNASDAIFWVDRQGRVVYANEAACRSLGHSREELLSLSVQDFNPSVKSWPPFWEKLKTDSSMVFESQHVTKQGKAFPVEVTANYLEFDGQEYSFAFVRDITERQALETQLRQAQKLESVGQLAAGIAHEINTPTQFVTDNLTFLRDSWEASHELLKLYRRTILRSLETLPPDTVTAIQQSEQKCDLDFIATEVPHAIEQGLEGVQRVAKIVRAMKDFSHPDSPDKSAADLNRAIESTITVARSEWKYVAEIATEFDENLPPVVCYPGDVNQVILNLVVNAAHAIKEKLPDGAMGKITIRTKMLGEFAEISVTDTGTGIPEAIHNRIFDPFFTTKEVGKGTGQGLSLAHSVVVKKHSGKIWFETEMGQGTTFFIHLPIKPLDSAEEE